MTEKLRTLKSAKADSPSFLELRWSDGKTVRVNLSELLKQPSLRALADQAVFKSARVGDWGHSVVWPDGTELGADRLWLETLSATQRSDVREFLEWRMRNALSLSKAAEALHLSRRMVAYYSSGEREVPAYILLACHGWEDLQKKAREGHQSAQERELADLVA